MLFEISAIYLPVNFGDKFSLWGHICIPGRLTNYREKEDAFFDTKKVQ